MFSEHCLAIKITKILRSTKQKSSITVVRRTVERSQTQSKNYLKILISGILKPFKWIIQYTKRPLKPTRVNAKIHVTSQKSCDQSKRSTLW